MSSRIPGLQAIDPLAVPLPHGTEVTVRAERVLDGRRVPQGLIGRVVRAQGDTFEVQMSGVGTLTCARSELTPVRAGQLEFAVRREAAWEALWPCRVLEATVGSRAWNLADATSDVDLRGGFALPLSCGRG